jgi:hypothetical protein
MLISIGSYKSKTLNIEPCDTPVMVAALKKCTAEKGLHYMDVGDLNNGRNYVFLALKLELVRGSDGRRVVWHAVSNENVDLNNFFVDDLRHEVGTFANLYMKRRTIVSVLLCFFICGERSVSISR